MKPRLILLFVLVTGTVFFMRFLMMQSGTPKIACEKEPCCKEAPCPSDKGGGGGEIDNGSSFNHLIVSTIK